MSFKIFIDGESGTTGLGIRAHLTNRPGIELKTLPEAARKDPQAKLALMNDIDLMVLCLPDQAAIEVAGLAREMGDAAPRILDASTAHRVAPGWTYGFPELVTGQACAIKSAKNVANPGCYATGAIALLRPLVEAGFIEPEFPISINAVSGYSGGGKAMIAAYEENRAPAYEAYALGLEHKHIPEIMAYGGLNRQPIFTPSVGNFAQGMLVFIPLFLENLVKNPGPEDLYQALLKHYGENDFVKVMPAEASGRIEPESVNGTNRLELRVYANVKEKQAVLAAKLDNLGKGASGAALQNIELMLGT
jgi:N-acetyl-gamma-glutamyl-phosphate reductase